MSNRSEASWHHHLLVVGIALVLNSGLAIGLIRIATAHAVNPAMPATIEVTVLPPPVIKRVPQRLVHREVAVQDAVSMPDEEHHEDPSALVSTSSRPERSTQPLQMTAAPTMNQHPVIPIKDTRFGFDRSHPPVESPISSVPLMVDQPFHRRDNDLEETAPAPSAVLSLTSDPDNGSPQTSPHRATVGIPGGDGAPSGSHRTPQPGGNGHLGTAPGHGTDAEPGKGPGASPGSGPANPGQGNNAPPGGGRTPSGTPGDRPKGEPVGTGTAPGSPTPPGGTPGDGTTSGNRVGARVTRDAQPAYPRDARRDGVEGTTVLRVSLDTKGRVTAVEVATSSGDTRLDDAAVRSVRTWKFSPASEDGKAVASSIRVRVQFRLD